MQSIKGLERHAVYKRTKGMQSIKGLERHAHGSALVLQILMEFNGDAHNYNRAIKEELEEVKKTMQEMEEETASLGDLQAKLTKEIKGPANTVAAAEAIRKKEADSRSVFVGNVDYTCTPQDVQHHFQSCGTVNRVTILPDKCGQPKGYAYVQFLKEGAVQNALLLNQSVLHYRKLKVTSKRTNIPGMNLQARRYCGGQRLNPYARPYLPSLFLSWLREWENNIMGTGMGKQYYGYANGKTLLWPQE